MYTESVFFKEYLKRFTEMPTELNVKILKLKSKLLIFNCQMIMLNF